MCRFISNSWAKAPAECTFVLLASLDSSSHQQPKKKYLLLIGVTLRSVCLLFINHISSLLLIVRMKRIITLLSVLTLLVIYRAPAQSPSARATLNGPKVTVSGYVKDAASGEAL